MKDLNIFRGLKKHKDDKGNLEQRFVTEGVDFLLKLSTRFPNKVWNKLLKLGEALDTTGEFRSAITAMREGLKMNHPLLKIPIFVAKKSPNCRKKLIKNFFLNAVLKGRKKRIEFAKVHNTPEPFFFVISPTMKCNLHCIGCYAGNYPHLAELPLEVIDKVFTDAKEMGIYFITVSGGEPFMKKGLTDLFAKHDDIMFQVYTNGTLIDMDLAKKLADLGNVAPVIALEGLEEETDYRRGKGVFKKISKAFDNLNKAGVIYGFSTVPASYNYSTLLKEDFYKFLVDKGVLFGWLFQYIPIGREPDIKLMLTPEQRVTLYEKTQEIRNKYPLFVSDFWNDGDFVNGCLAGARSGGGYFHINSKGDVEPCVFVHFAQDNIIDIYNRGGHLWDALNSSFFKAIRAGQPWGEKHQMPCMVIDHPHCLRNLVRKTHPKPTEEGVELLIQDSPISKHLDRYSAKLDSLLEEKGTGRLKKEEKEVA